MKKRILTSYIDFLLFIIIYNLQLLYVDYINFGSGVKFQLISIIIVFIIYFGIFTRLTKGYTIGGLITKLRIIHIDGTKISINIYIKRTFFAMLTFFNSYLKGIRIMNGFGQLDYDIRYNTTVLPKDIFLNELKKNNKYIFITILIVAMGSLMLRGSIDLLTIFSHSHVARGTHISI